MKKIFIFLFVSISIVSFTSGSSEKFINVNNCNPDNSKIHFVWFLFNAQDSEIRLINQNYQKLIQIEPYKSLRDNLCLWVFNQSLKTTETPRLAPYYSIGKSSSANTISDRLLNNFQYKNKLTYKFVTVYGNIFSISTNSKTNGYYMKSIQSQNGEAHEIGHFFGLIDEYGKDTKAPVTGDNCVANSTDAFKKGFENLYTGTPSVCFNYNVPLSYCYFVYNMGTFKAMTKYRCIAQNNKNYCMYQENNKIICRYSSSYSIDCTNLKSDGCGYSTKGIRPTERGLMLSTNYNNYGKLEEQIVLRNIHGK